MVCTYVCVHVYVSVCVRVFMYKPGNGTWEDHIYLE